MGTDDALIPLYRWFFENIVALAPPLFGLLAAAYEVTIALMMLSRGRYARWGLIGGIVFLIGTTPLSVWTLTNPVMALALVSLLRREYDRSLPEMLRRPTRRGAVGPNRRSPAGRSPNPAPRGASGEE